MMPPFVTKDSLPQGKGESGEQRSRAVLVSSNLSFTIKEPEVVAITCPETEGA